MRRRSWVIIPPTHVYAVLWKQFYGLIQFFRIPSFLQLFVSQSGAVHETPKSSILYRHVIPKYRRPSICQCKVADFFKPFHLQFKRSLSCCLAAFINTNGRNLIAADMQVFSVWHSLQRIFIQIELQIVSGRVGRTKLPVTCRVLTQFPMVLQYISCVAQPLHQRSYFYVPFLCIPAYGPHFLLAQGIGRADFRMPGEAQLVVNLPYDGIYLVARQFIYSAIIIFSTVQVVLVVEMDSTVTNLRIICYPHLRNYKVEVTAVFHQLLQSIKKAGTCSG